MNPIPGHNRRRIVLINPRLQMGLAFVFSAVVVAGGALFAWFLFRDMRVALWNASFQGHYQVQTPFQIIRGILVRDLACLFAGVAFAGLIAGFLLMRRIRSGMERVVEVFGRSAEGDLSTPTNASGTKDIVLFGKQVDAIRDHTLKLIEEVRADASDLRRSSPPQEEFLKRWEELKAKIGRVVP